MIFSHLCQMNPPEVLWCISPSAVVCVYVPCSGFGMVFCPAGVTPGVQLWGWPACCCTHWVLLCSLGAALVWSPAQSSAADGVACCV